MLAVLDRDTCAIAGAVRGARGQHHFFGGRQFARLPIRQADDASIPPIPFVYDGYAHELCSSTLLLLTPPPAPVSQPISPTGLQIQGLGSEAVPWSIHHFAHGIDVDPYDPAVRDAVCRWLLIVFHFLRQALGLRKPTLFEPDADRPLAHPDVLPHAAGRRADLPKASILPLQAGQITSMEALTRGEVPMRKFMSHYVREKDVAMFVDLAKEPRPNSPDDVSMRVLLPAYILSELKAGIQIGTVLFLPRF